MFRFAVLIVLCVSFTGFCADTKKSAFGPLEPNDIFAKVSKAYTDLKSFDANCTVSVEKYSSKHVLQSAASGETRFRVHLGKPNYYIVEWSGVDEGITFSASAFCDGGQSYTSFFKKCNLAGSAEDAIESMLSETAGGAATQPGLFFKLKIFEFPDSDLKFLPDQKVDGELCYVISGTSKSMAGDEMRKFWAGYFGKDLRFSYSVKLFISKTNSILLRRIVTRQTSDILSDPNAIVETHYDEKYDRIKLNQPYKNWMFTPGYMRAACQRDYEAREREAAEKAKAAPAAAKTDSPDPAQSASAQTSAPGLSAEPAAASDPSAKPKDVKDPKTCLMENICQALKICAEKKTRWPDMLSQAKSFVTDANAKFTNYRYIKPVSLTAENAAEIPVLFESHPDANSTSQLVGFADAHVESCDLDRVKSLKRDAMNQKPARRKPADSASPSPARREPRTRSGT